MLSRQRLVQRLLLSVRSTPMMTTTTMIPRRTVVQNADEVSARVSRVLHDYRKHGHVHAKVNPIEPHAAQFQPQLYGLSAADVITDRTLTSANVNTVGELLEHLEKVYCNTLALEVRKKKIFIYLFIFILFISFSKGGPFG
jgi:2-oxoglutarate dehydrogenase complex dehydrogenase (E1) component-like enzyme